jgi:hypothetical protein
MQQPGSSPTPSTVMQFKGIYKGKGRGAVKGKRQDDQSSGQSSSTKGGERRWSRQRFLCSQKKR